MPQFWAGLRARNWAGGGRHFQRDAAPWRVQLFRCGDEGVTRWTGLRALVTQTTTNTSEKSDAASSGGVVFPARFWVDMPVPGDVLPLDARTLGDPNTAGYNAVLAQLYQAHQQRVSKRAAQAVSEQGYALPGTYAYDCPGERLLDVSWHWTPQAITNPLARFLVRGGLQTKPYRCFHRNIILFLYPMCLPPLVLPDQTSPSTAPLLALLPT